MIVGETRDVVRRVRVDAAPQRGHQRHHLERRARPAVALRGEVEVRLAVVARRRHRLDVAVARVERDDRRRRADAGEVVGDRVARLGLLVEVDRRVDLHAARAHGLRAVLAEQLVLDVVEEVLLAALGEVRRELEPERLGHRRLRPSACVIMPSSAILSQHLVAALLGGALAARRRVVRRRLRQAGEQRGLVAG